MKAQFILFISAFICLSVSAKEPEYDHIFFDNSLMTGRYYYSKADYTSPSYIQSIEKRLVVSEKEFYTAKNSILLNYVSAVNGSWSASILYQDWRGKDFIKEGKSLDFKLLVKSNTKVEELPSIAIGTLLKKEVKISSFISLEKYIHQMKQGEWISVHIPLRDFKDISYTHTKEIKEVLFKQNSQDGKEHTLYIDQMELLPVNTPQPIQSTPTLKARAYERHVDLSWDKTGLENAKYIKIYRSSNGKDFENVGIQDPYTTRYADYSNKPNKTFQYYITGVNYDYTESQPSNTTEVTTYYMTDEELLTMVQESAFRYFWDGGETESGLGLENIPGRRNMIATGASGFGIMGIIAGVERGFITRDEAVQRLNKILTFLDKADTFHGGFAHFIDGTTGKVEPFFGMRDNGADMVETSFLFQGLLTARQYFDKNNTDEKFIRNTITKLWENIDWSWYKKTKDSKYLYWHWSPDQEWVINHKLIGWNETMITYLLAIASPTHGISEDMYYSGWASQEKEAYDYRSGWGETTDGANYYNGNTYYGVKLDVGVNRGGPIFFTHFSFFGFDPRGLKDKYTSKDYFDNLRNIALISYRYSIENPNKRLGFGPGCWGLTASESPWGYGAAEAMAHHEYGTMSPAGAIASMVYLPEESMGALKNYYRNFGSFLWGEYGFRDTFNLDENWCSNIYMGLSQGSIIAMTENYRSGLIWNLFMKDPDIQKMRNKVFIK
ncbi:MAG: glucoamylase family protein [Dysgonomonas sp.]|nr:glucoamylase family protein [Dysgonomonas sp.]